MVTIHAPSIPETDRMIGAEQLRLLRDDGVWSTPRGAPYWTTTRCTKKQRPAGSRSSWT